MEKLFYLDSCPSTQDLAQDYLLSLESAPTESIGFYTFSQTQGRGQYGSTWTSEPGQNLAYTLIFQMQNDISFPLFNYYTALLIRAYIAKLTEKNIWIKWPNDLILNKKKIGGILIETQKIYQKAFALIGIGINGNQKDFSHLPKASSLSLQIHKDIDLHTLVSGIHSQLCMGLARQGEDTLKEYNAHLFRKDEISVFDINKTRINGIIRYADQEGFLWVEHEDENLKSYFHKDLELLY